MTRRWPHDSSNACEAASAKTDIVITWHSTELEDDGLGPDDAASIVLTGTIVAAQREPNSGERKYVIEGHCLAGTKACAVVKLGGTGKLVFLSTWRGSQVDHL